MEIRCKACDSKMQHWEVHYNKDLKDLENLCRKCLNTIYVYVPEILFEEPIEIEDSENEEY